MKRKALVAVLLCVIGLTALGIGNAEAVWYNITINQIGSSQGDSYVQATDVSGSFTARWYVLDKSLGAEKQMLATLLTAFSNGNNLSVNVDDASLTVFGLFVAK